jgi:hypothetical protein
LERQKRNSGGIALIVATLALAQRLGGYENKPLAICLVIIAGAALFWFAGLWIRDGLRAHFVSEIEMLHARQMFDLKTRYEQDLSSLSSKLDEPAKQIGEINLQLFNARAQLADAKNELHRRDTAAAQAEEQRRKEESLVRGAPQLWVDFEARKDGSTDPEDWQSLIFSKDGGGAIKTIDVGPLEWRIQESHPIELHSVVGPLRGQSVSCKFSVAGHLSLTGLFREMMRKYDPQAQPSSEIQYEDFDGHRFSRKFTLSIDPFDRIAWHPDSVQLAPYSAAEFFQTIGKAINT